MINALNGQMLTDGVSNVDIEVTNNLCTECSCNSIFFNTCPTQGYSLVYVGGIIASAGKGDNVTMVCRLHGLPQRIGPMKYRNFTLMAQRGD